MGEVIHEENGNVRFEFHESEALQFKDLKVGDKFIAMPLPGDDSGHGGFKGEFPIFKKIEVTPNYKFSGTLTDNAILLSDGTARILSSNIWVIQIR
ncbi:hypothetical protein MYX06_02035 [Patescibacteria group bacterium AH-259-L05]|nr:hypothetical protein [Patescibacteria group bacterium AH-259-L05]